MEIIVFIFSALLLLFIYKHKPRRVNNFPSPPGYFFFGHIFDLRLPEKRLQTLLEYIKGYGLTVRANVGPYLEVLLTTDWKLIELILTKRKGSIKSENYQYLKPWLGTGLLITDGAEWKHTRKILTPTFSTEILKKYVQVFESMGDVLVDKIKKYDDSNSVDLCSLVHSCTLDIICETAMGTNINAQKGENSSYVKSVEEMCEIVINRGSSVAKLKNWSFVFTWDYYRQRKIVKILHEFTSRVIARRKEILNLSEMTGKLSFLDALLNYRDEDGAGLKDEKIRQEVDTFMFAGHDTTAAALCFTLYCLSNHPDIQEKVLNEQKELFGGDKTPKIEYQDLQNMKYLENVIKESLRLYPPVPLLGRLTTEDLPYGDHIIGKNTNIGLFIYGLHRNPEIFPNPEEFDPDRFNSGSYLNSFLPFGGGQRNCIGQKFALFELKSVISKLIRHFEFRAAIPKHELVLSPDVVLKSLNGIKVGLQQRL